MIDPVSALREALAVAVVDMPLFVIGNVLDVIGYHGLEVDE